MAEVVRQQRAAGISKPVVWTEWWAELKAVAEPTGYIFVHEGNESAWRDYFIDEYSPAEAIEEDLKQACLVRTAT